MKKTILFFGLAILLTACQLSPVPQPTVTPTFTPKPTNTLPPTVTSTLTSTATYTPAPTATSTPIPTVTPTETLALNCSADELIEKLKQQISYDDYTLSYNIFNGVRYLFFWIMDPSINPRATETELESNFDLAVQHSIELAYQLKQADVCTTALFDAINPVVVDQNYNGWFSGVINMGDLPASSELTASDIFAIKDIIMAEGAWQRQTITDIQEIPPDSCTWSEVLERVSWHFFDAPLNAYMLVADNNGLIFTVQYQGRGSSVGDQAVVFLNTAREVACLQPPVDIITVIIVDELGNVISVQPFPMNP